MSQLIDKPTVVKEETSASTSSSVQPISRCVVCEEPLISGQYFPLPTQYPELKRWALGLFPTNPDEFELFIDYIRNLKTGNVPKVCIDHFAARNLFSVLGKPIQLRPQAVPQMYGGSMRTRTDMLWQRRKCIVCGALRPSDEMYPFTQKPSILSIWCKSLYPKDKKAAERMYMRVARSVSPTLCGEHFDRSCFERASKDLKPNVFPTMAKVRATPSVMNILKSAQADLQKVLPGNFIPRDEIWEKMDKKSRLASAEWARQKAVHTEGINKLLQKAALEMKEEEKMTQQGTEEHVKDKSPVLFDSNQPEVKEEDGKLLEETPALEGNCGSSAKQKECRKKNPKRKTIRPRKELSPMELRRARAVQEESDSAVTTRSGRQVKRRVKEYEEPERRERTKKSRVQPTRLSSSSSDPPKQEIADGLVESESGSASNKTSVSKQDKSNGSKTSRPYKLLVPKIKCTVCQGNSEATVFGMMEHAREHSEDTLKCPFDDCDFSSNKRGKISHHTQNVHRRWAFPVDLCDTVRTLSIRLRSKMYQCFPSAMDRVNEPGSVSCSICSLVVSPDYRSLYSHACRHLPSRSYMCSECSSFEAYTEDEIEEHHNEIGCGGDIVSNMDDAVASLTEKLFKSAFPSHAHLLDVDCPVDLPMDEESNIAPVVADGPAPMAAAQDECKKEEEQDNNDCDIPWEDFKCEEKASSSVLSHVEHDHQYCASAHLLNHNHYNELLDAGLNVDEIGKYDC